LNVFKTIYNVLGYAHIQYSFL